MNYFPFRYSNNIEKQILWYFLVLFFFRKKYKQVLDVGCGYGKNIRFIRFSNYKGIDIDKKRITINKKKLANKRINFEVQDIMEEGFLRNEKYDLIILIQVLTNSLFKKKSIELALKNLIKICHGKLIFNTSIKNIDDIKKIDKYLKDSKINFKKINYGIPTKIRNIKFPILSQIISFIYLIIIISNTKIMNNEKIIYICKIN